MIKRNYKNYYVVQEDTYVANIFCDTDWDDNGNYFAVVSYTAKDVVFTYDEYLTNHGNEKIKSKEQMDVIFSEIVTNSESVSGTVKLPIDYEDGEYVISDMSELIDIMYGRLVSHIKELHDKEVEGNKESKGE